MPSPFTPDPYALEEPSPVAAPGESPVLDLPVDGDPPAAATWEQAYKVLGNYIAFIQGAARLEKPNAPSTTSGISRAFTEVIPTGVASGTIKPTAGIACYGYRYRFLITLSGVVGVAKFRVSTDGGATYGTEQTTAASYTDASGVTVAFVGTFTLDDTYSFRGIDTPLALWHESGEKARELVSHNGYPMGQISAFREDWSHAVTAALSTTVTETPFPGYSRWNYALDTGNVGPSPVPTIAYGFADTAQFNTIKITGSTAAGSLISWLKHARLLGSASTTSAVTFECRWMVRAPDNSAAQTGYVGLSSSPAGMTGAHPFGVMFKFTGTGNWRAQVLDDTTTVLDADTGIAPNTGAAADFQMMQIEYHGPDSPVGVLLGDAIWRFLIDGEQVAIIAYSDLVCSLQPFQRQDSTAATPAPMIEFGPVWWGSNWLNDPVRM